MHTPYTYYIFHKPTNQHYYGGRWAKKCAPSDFWVSYFTSSKIVHELIERYGKDSFEVEIRKVFKNSDDCKNWERGVLKRLSVVKKSNWINQSYGTPPTCNFSRKGQGSGRALTTEHKLSISRGNTGKKRDDIHKQKISAARSQNTGWHHSESTKSRMSSSARLHQQVYTFKRDNVTYEGTLSDWADAFNINKSSAATTFCNSKIYKGWVRRLT